MIAALRTWLLELTIFECVDYVAGFPSRYAPKLFSPRPVRSLGRNSLGLGAGVDEEVDVTRKRIWSYQRGANQWRMLYRAAFVR